MAQPMYLTPEGLANLKAESEELRTGRRQMVAERIQKAKEIGGTVDNAEYDEAKNEQAFIEGRILTLDNIINNAIIISEAGGPLGCSPDRIQGYRAESEEAEGAVYHHR